MVKGGFRWFLAVVVLAAGLGIVAIGGPADLPPSWQGYIMTRTWAGDSELFVHAFWCTAESLPLAWDAQSAADQSSARAVMSVLAAKWPGRQLLLITIIPDQAGRFYWWPLSLVVTQGGKQYDVGVSDLLKYDDAFGGGLLYETVVGWVALPADVDVHQSFKLWYGEDSMTLGPFVY